MTKLECGHCYSIAGRTPIVVQRYEIVFGKGMFGKQGGYIYIEGWTRRAYKIASKFWEIPDSYAEDYKAGKPVKTIGELEGLEEPPLTKFRFRQHAKIVEVPL